MAEIAWGEPVEGVRFGLQTPGRELEAGGTIVLAVHVENHTRVPISLFGFQARYPRSLRISPPKPDRAFIRVSFADVNVLHQSEAFVQLRPGESGVTQLDLSFAFDRRGVGVWPLVFAYDQVRGGLGAAPWFPVSNVAPRTGIVNLLVTAARSLREAGIDDALEQWLDEALLRGEARAIDKLRELGEGGGAYVARRITRVLSPTSESALGWRAMEALAALGERGVRGAEAARTELPHASHALDFAIAWARHRMGAPPAPEHLPFAATLDELAFMPDRRGNFVLSWLAYDSPVHGTRQLQLFGNGERVVVSRPAGSTVPETRRTVLGELQMRTVIDALRYAASWLLVPLRERGMPDEPRPALEVQLGLGEPFVRRCAMWNGEWRQGPAAGLADLLDRLAADGANTGSAMSLPPPR